MLDFFDQVLYETLMQIVSKLVVAVIMSYVAKWIKGHIQKKSLVTNI